MNTENFHKEFCLNGKQFNSKIELLSYSESINASVHSFLIDWFNDNEFVEVNTSGSTGKPKLIQLKKEYMVNSAIATGCYFDLEEETTALLCLSTDFIAGKMILVRALTLGWYLDVIEPDSHPLNGMSKQYDFCAMVPMQLFNSLPDLHLVKKLIVGGGAVSNDLQLKIQDLKTEVFATYGMTETITHIAVKKLNNLSLREVPITIGTTRQSVYSVLPNIKISKDSRDCLVIDAPKLSDERIITNDLVEIVSDSEFKWLGRYDSIINSGGVKLIPEQIENRLSAIIDQRFFVAGISDKVLGEKLILVVELNVTSSDFSEKNSIEKVKGVILSKAKNLSSLSKFEVPKEIYYIEKFVETETKKIQRQKTLDLLFK